MSGGTNISLVKINAFQLVNAELSLPIAFAAEFGLSGDSIAHYELSLDPAVQSANIKTTHGMLQILDFAKRQLQYTPEFGYRGGDSGFIFLRNAQGLSLKMALRIVIGNSLHQFAPALAVRGTGCVTCHANVQSNFVTDFGYRGNGQGRDYYFGNSSPTGLSWNSGNIYGDHGSGSKNADGTMAPSSWQTMAMASTQKVFVQRALVPSGPATMWGISTLAQYVQAMLSSSPNISSRSVTVEEREIFIGAPTQGRLREAFKSSDLSPHLQFYKEASDSANLSGLSLRAGTNYFQNNGDMVCEGDLFIEGSLRLQNLNLRSRTGCRLYVTGSVLVSGPIAYLSTESDLRNLQITSSKAILMGLGSLIGSNGLCETTAGQWYFDRWADPNISAADKQTKFSSTLLLRMRYVWTTPSYETRSPLSVTDTHESVIADINQMSAVVDASCESTGRKVTFERILLNAPIIQSRYNGDVLGTVIAEYAVMSLGAFKFKYDPVFSKVPVLPFLQQKDYLLIQ